MQMPHWEPGKPGLPQSRHRDSSGPTCCTALTYWIVELVTTGEPVFA
jgi:hypothetical protein